MASLPFERTTDVVRVQNPQGKGKQLQTKTIPLYKRAGNDDAQRYICCAGDMWGNVFFRQEDFVARANQSDEAANAAVLNHDISVDTVDAPKWNANGTTFDKTTAKAPKLFTGSLKTSGLMNGFKDNPTKLLSAYKTTWIAISKDAEGDKAPRPAFDKMNRFYAGRNVSYVFVPLAAWPDRDTLEGLAKIAIPSGAPAFRVLTEAQAKENDPPLITVSYNPLGFYRTMMTKVDIEKLEQEQTESQTGTWIRPWPTQAQIAVLQNDVKNADLRFVPTTTSTLSLVPRTRAARGPEPAKYMKGSANDWAAKTLHWQAGPITNNTPGEWLHRSAHNVGTLSIVLVDSPGNIMFGSNECNTNMIRAETLIDDAPDRFAAKGLDGNGCQSVLTTSASVGDEIHMLSGTGDSLPVEIPKYLTRGEKEEGYPWLIPQLSYTIEYRFNTGVQQPARAFESLYQPFHRYIPLRPDAQLDSKVFDAYLDLMQVSGKLDLVKAPNNTTTTTTTTTLSAHATPASSSSSEHHPTSTSAPSTLPGHPTTFTTASSTSSEHHTTSTTTSNPSAGHPLT